MGGLIVNTMYTGMIMGIFEVVISHTAELDYSTMEYLGSIDNPDEIFHAEILLSGLGESWMLQWQLRQH